MLDDQINVVQHWYTYPPKTSYRDVAGIIHNDLTLEPNEEINIYIHIPFCNMKCTFCSLFTSAGHTDNSEQVYVEHLLKEIRATAPIFKGSNARFRNVYFGGGTPALLKDKNVEAIVLELENAASLADTQMSVEFSPDVATLEALKMWRAAGFGRVSIGVQTFLDKQLKALARKHSSRDATTSIERAFDCGFEELNVDLIFGHLGQTKADWQYDLVKLADTPANMVTFHPLATVNKVPVERKLNDKAAAPSLMRNMHDSAIQFFRSIDWQRTSAISFAKYGQPNPLEMSEARGMTTIGFGAGARTYHRSFHASTLPSSKKIPFGGVLSAYYTQINQGLKPALSVAEVSDEEFTRRKLVLGMHHGAIEKLVISELENKKTKSKVVEQLREFVRDGLFIENETEFELTDLGAANAAMIGVALSSECVRSNLATANSTGPN